MTAETPITAAIREGHSTFGALADRLEAVLAGEVL